MLGLPAAYAAYAGRGYPGYASFGLPYPAGKLKVSFESSFTFLAVVVVDPSLEKEKENPFWTRNPVVVFVSIYFGGPVFAFIFFFWF